SRVSQNRCPQLQAAGGHGLKPSGDGRPVEAGAVEAAVAAALGLPVQAAAREQPGKPNRRRATKAVTSHRVLIGREHEPQAILTSSSDEGVWLTMLDEEGNLRVRLGADKAGLPALMLFTAMHDEQPGTKGPLSVTRLTLECVPDPFGPDGSFPVVSLFDQAGNCCAALLAQPGGNSSLTFYEDRETACAWRLHSDLGSTRYTKETIGPACREWRLTNLWEAERIMRVVRNSGEVPPPLVVARLMFTYGGLWI
ncbi:MAG TPA: hypothetical protein VJX67_03740, partial [Blastocatellia bacterium]|nr:hypothetical protein [Blastocatellia bacterium]